MVPHLSDSRSFSAGSDVPPPSPTESVSQVGHNSQHNKIRQLRDHRSHLLHSSDIFQTQPLDLGLCDRALTFINYSFPWKKALDV